MEEHDSQTFICSVLFLDIVGYSKQSVAVQISIKERFVNYLAIAISEVPQADRVILDSGDGAAINFLGEVDDALRAALSLRSSLLHDANVLPPLLLRMGINLGPVRLVRESDGQPNIVGDGINVAQRIMDFADPGQICVTRAYYEAVARLSERYAEMFCFQGSRTDKHVREHEIYAFREQSEQSLPEKVSGSFDLIADENNDLSTRSKQSNRIQRAMYFAAFTLFILLCIALMVKLL